MIQDRAPDFIHLKYQNAANTQLTNINNVVTALEKLQSENKNALLQGTIDEAVRRAKLEQAHYQSQFDKLVAASMALAGMPAINGRGISIGVGSFDGESAFAVGFQIQSDNAQ